MDVVLIRVFRFVVSSAFPMQHMWQLPAQNKGIPCHLALVLLKIL